MEPNSGANSIDIRNMMKMPDTLYGIRHFHLEFWFRSLKNRIQAVNGKTGAIEWSVVGSAGTSIELADLNRDGVPEILYMNDYNGALTMLDHNGRILTDTWIHHPCWGGMALADTDLDGQYEIYLSDRRDGYHDFPASGIQAFNAHRQILLICGLTHSLTHCPVFGVHRPLT